MINDSMKGASWKVVVDSRRGPELVVTRPGSNKEMILRIPKNLALILMRRGDNWLFFLEARVSFQYVLADPEEEAHAVMKKMDEIANAVFDDALAAGKCRRASQVRSLLAWDKSDPNTAGHPWADPDVRDDFPGLCCYPGCSAKSLYLKPVCVEHLKNVCPDCGWVILPGSGCKCNKTEADVEIELKKRHPRKPLNIEPCRHMVGRSCDWCIKKHGIGKTPCDLINKEVR